MNMSDVGRFLEDLKRMCGTVTEVGGPLPDGSGYATATFPLPKNHWLTADGYNVPPMPLRCGAGMVRSELVEQVRAAARYAVRASTMNGKEDDFDPDAMVGNFVVGLLGYFTSDGTSGDAWANPDPIPPRFDEQGNR